MTLENVLLFLGGMGLAFVIQHVSRNQGWKDSEKVHIRLYEDLLNRQEPCNCPACREEEEEGEEWNPENN